MTKFGSFVSIVFCIVGVALNITVYIIERVALQCSNTGLYNSSRYVKEISLCTDISVVINNNFDCYFM